MSTREHAWNDPWSFDVDGLLAATRVYPVDGPTITSSDSVYSMPPWSSVKMCDGRVMHVWSSGTIFGGGAVTNQARYIMQGYAPDEDTYCDTHNSVDTGAARTLLDAGNTYKNHVIASVSRVGEALVMVATSDTPSMTVEADVGPWVNIGVNVYTSWDEGETWVNPLDGISTFALANPATANFYHDPDEGWQSYQWWLTNVYPYYRANRPDIVEDAGTLVGRNMPRMNIATECTASNEWAIAGSCEGNNGQAFRRRNGEYWVTYVDLSCDNSFPDDYNWATPCVGRLKLVPSAMGQSQMFDSEADYERTRDLTYFVLEQQTPVRAQVFNVTTAIARYQFLDQWTADYPETPGYVEGDSVRVTDVDVGDNVTTLEAWPGMMLVEDDGVLYTTISRSDGNPGRVYMLRHDDFAYEDGIEWIEYDVTYGVQYASWPGGTGRYHLKWLDDLDDLGSTAQACITWFMRELTDGSVKHWWLRSGTNTTDPRKGGSFAGPCYGLGSAVTADDFSQDAVPAAGDIHRIHSVLFRGDDRVWAPFTTAGSSNDIALQATPKVEPPCKYPKRLLHIPYPKWQRENDGDGNLDHLWTNWLVWDRWVHQMVKDTERPGDATCGEITPPTMDKTCRIPHYRAAHAAEHEQNWLAVERWSRQFCWAPHLHLPHKKPVQVHHDEQNWAALMRWVQVVVETGKTRHPGCPGLGL